MGVGGAWAEFGGWRGEGGAGGEVGGWGGGGLEGSEGVRTRYNYIVRVEAKGRQHWPVLHLFGIHRSNEIPKKVVAAEARGHLFARTAEGRPSLCGDL